MNALRCTALAAFAVLLWAQSDPVKGHDRIVDADAAQVAHCTFVQDVDGRSVFGERLAQAGVSKAKEDARNQAAKAGATHVVWGKVSSTDVTTVAGKAYLCKG
ncbi:MAG TPA: hypothetical protein VGO25_01095 [Rhodanobacteraceae bacterium]|jgi:hypothetical protein|nr:hypothetical protein [Rhodanobacteraceae bacterium]